MMRLLDIVMPDTDMYGVTIVESESAFPTGLILAAAAVAVVAVVLIIKAVKKKK